MSLWVTTRTYRVMTCIALGDLSLSGPDWSAFGCTTCAILTQVLVRGPALVSPSSANCLAIRRRARPNATHTWTPIHCGERQNKLPVGSQRQWGSQRANWERPLLHGRERKIAKRNPAPRGAIRISVGNSGRYLQSQAGYNRHQFWPGEPFDIEIIEYFSPTLNLPTSIPHPKSNTGVPLSSEMVEPSTAGLSHRSCSSPRFARCRLIAHVGKRDR